MSRMLNDSNIAIDKRDSMKRVTLVNLKPFEIYSKSPKKTFGGTCEKFRYILYRGVENIYFQVVVLAIALYSLFYKEILLLSLPKSYDYYFHFAIEVFWFILLLEFCICLIAKKKYLFSFDFWIDIIALIGMLPEVEILWKPILNLISNSR
jgi:hypothetical protein